MKVEWIDVDNAVPAAGKDVLAHVWCVDIKKGFMSVMTRMGDNSWCSEAGNRVNENLRMVTHWSPLPVSPLGSSCHLAKNSEKSLQ